MVEVEQHTLPCFIQRGHGGCHARLPIGRRELQHLAYMALGGLFIRLGQGAAGNPLLFGRVGLAKHAACGQGKRGAAAFCQPQQMLLQRFGQLAATHLQRGGRIGKGIDDIAIGASQAVMQGQKRIGLHRGRRSG